VRAALRLTPATGWLGDGWTTPETRITDRWKTSSHHQLASARLDRLICRNCGEPPAGLACRRCAHRHSLAAGWWTEKDHDPHEGGALEGAGREEYRRRCSLLAGAG
jgi:ribosomal protein L40E